MSNTIQIFQYSNENIHFTHFNRVDVAERITEVFLVFVNS